MKRRWFIRICFMLPVLLCVVGWGWSTRYQPHLSYCHAGNTYTCSVVRGLVLLSRARVGLTMTDGSIAFPEDGWKCFTASTSSPTSPLGFKWMHFRTVIGDTSIDARQVGVPLWFLILPFSALFCFVWRKTGKLKPGRAFPVEIAVKP